MNILALGVVAIDTLETPFGKVENVIGGSGTHFSYVASFFAPVHLVSIIGQDFPQEFLSLLRERQIDLSGLEIREGKTFRWSGQYGFDLNSAKTLNTELNLLNSYDPKIPKHLRACDYLFLANIDPEMQLKVLDQVKKPKISAMDTMNFWISSKKDQVIEVMRRVDVVLINEGEARQLTGEALLVKAARTILSYGPRLVVIKRGEYGALLFANDHVFSAPGLPLEKIMDPTGAGDSFAGGFMGYLAKTGQEDYQAFRKAVIAGSVMASFNVEDFSLNRLKEVNPDLITRRMAEFKHLTHFEDIHF